MAGGDCCMHEGETLVEDSLFEDGEFAGWRAVCVDCGEVLAHGVA
jgi:hypothetical protein